MPSSIRKALNGLPVTLDDTYERILQAIPKQKVHHAHRLFQCMVAAIRPLRVEELAEIFAIEFGPNVETNLVEGWRPANSDEAVLSTCSTLISIIDNEGSKIVQFSHFSVKEFLTSERLQLSHVGNICQYYIPLEPAHTILARACLTVLLQFDEKVNKGRLATFPLAFYAAQHWFDHAKFEAVEVQIQDSMERLFNPKEPYFRAWIWIHDMDQGREKSMQDLVEYPPSPRNTPLFYAASCGFSGLAKHLIITHAEDVNADCNFGWGPLHAASVRGMFDAARMLLDHGADVNKRDLINWEPIHFASYDGYLKIVQLLLERGATLNAQSNAEYTPLCLASEAGHLEVVRLLLDHGASVNVRGYKNRTAFQVATKYGHHNVTQLLVERGAEGA